MQAKSVTGVMGAITGEIVTESSYIFRRRWLYNRRMTDDAPSPEAPKPRVLLIQDRTNINGERTDAGAQLKDALTGKGFEVFTAANHVDAAHTLATKFDDFDVILCDNRIKHDSNAGADFLLRAAQRVVPVVVMSEHEQDQVLLSKLGARAFVPKRYEKKPQTDERGNNIWRLETSNVSLIADSVSEALEPKLKRNGKPRILLVEDDERLGRVLPRLLEVNGYEVIHAVGHRSAARNLHRWEFDAVITDNDTDKPNAGLAFLREHPEISVPVIMISKLEKGELEEQKGSQMLFVVPQREKAFIGKHRMEPSDVARARANSHGSSVQGWDTVDVGRVLKTLQRMLQPSRAIDSTSAAGHGSIKGEVPDPMVEAGR